MAGKIKKSFAKSVKNPLETVGDFGDPSGIVKGVGTSLVDDLGKGATGDFLEFLGLKGAGNEKNTEASASDDIFNFRNASSEKIEILEKQGKQMERKVEAAINYHRDVVKSSERASRQELQSVSSQIQQIKTELIALSKSTKMLQLEIASVSVEQTTENIGVYHAHFFEWMLGMLKAARERVETSEAWMGAQKGKAGKKGYWGMFKKHGTSFGLSNERSVATQVG
jgi:hypothetical protein